MPTLIPQHPGVCVCLYEKPAQGGHFVFNSEWITVRVLFLQYTQTNGSSWTSVWPGCISDRLNLLPSVYLYVLRFKFCEPSRMQRYEEKYIHRVYWRQDAKKFDSNNWISRFTWKQTNTAGNINLYDFSDKFLFIESCYHLIWR